ncbi:MAG: hypothetical protein FJ211_07805 [Ignavibacteria bacterium]|nr:hypothetical protein [Ignavibacteria bacterium]
MVHLENSESIPDLQGKVEEGADYWLRMTSYELGRYTWGSASVPPNRESSLVSRVRGKDVRYSLFAVRYSLFAVRCSLLAVLCSLLFLSA